MRFAPLVLAALLVAGGASRAEALTIRDVIELTKAGIADEVLLALIDVDAGVYAIDAATLKALKEAGVSERVMVALVRSGRERRAPEPAPVPVQEEDPAPPPQVVVVDHHEPQVQQVVVPVPVYVPVYTDRSRSHRSHDGAYRARPVESTYVPFQSGLPAARPESPRSAPAYWGFGGKLRPDAWGQPAHDRDKPSNPRKPSDTDGKEAKDARRERK